MSMPKDIIECISLRPNGCEKCDYRPRKLGRWENCNKRISLKYPEGVPANY